MWYGYAVKEEAGPRILGGLREEEKAMHEAS